eukprot:Skav222093  [mRNA]  locus=scaffold2165:235712:247418:- [translate_table: standard]
MDMDEEMPEGLDGGAEEFDDVPKKGDEVKVHYVGTLEDGTAVGEIAKFTLAPEFAYGEEGPGRDDSEDRDDKWRRATLVFEIELLGAHLKVPSRGQCYTVLHRAPLEKNTVLHSASVLHFGKNEEEEKKGRRRGEEGEKKGRMHRMHRMQCCQVEITLHEMYDNKVQRGAVNPAELRLASNRAGCSTLPLATGKCAMHWKAEFNVGRKLVRTSGQDDGVASGVASRVAWRGTGAVLEMKKGERAILTCSRPSSCTEPRLGLAPTAEAEQCSSACTVQRGIDRKEVGES